MKQIYKKIIVAVISVSVLAAGCSGGGTQQKYTIKIWKPFVDSEKMQDIITAYNKKHPNVTIEYTKKNIDNYESDLLNALAAGNGPDIFSINNSWLPQYMDKVVAAPDKLFTLKEYKDTFVDVLSADFVKDNKIYGTAMWVDSLGLYYNKDLLGTAGIATPPKTWDELAQDSRRITQQDEDGYFSKSGVAIGLSSNVNRATDILYLMMLQAGAVPWSSDGRTAQFTKTISRDGKNYSPGVTATEFYTSFANPNSVNYTWNTDSDYSIDSFANGRSAFMYGYSYAREEINNKAPNLNYDTALAPQYKLGASNVNYANYFAEVVSKQSKVSDVAWDFLKFATGKDMLDKYYAKDKQPSSRRDLIELQASDEEIGVFATANLTAKSFYKFNETKFDKLMSDMIENVVLRGLKIDTALGQAQSQASALVQSSIFNK